MRAFGLWGLGFFLGLALMACPAEEPKTQAPPDDLPTPQKALPETALLKGPPVAENFDLSLVWEIVKRAPNGDKLGLLFNQSGIVNLDLNQDQRVDYLNLQEFQEAGQRGFTLYTYENEQALELATLTVTPMGERVEIMITGHPRHYGDNFRYFKNLESKEVALLAWLYKTDRAIFQPVPRHTGNLPPGLQIQGPLALTAYQAKIKNQALKWQ